MVVLLASVVEAVPTEAALRLTELPQASTVAATTAAAAWFLAAADNGTLCMYRVFFQG